ncbi:MAG: amidohydrolase family protein, partial [Acidobacteriota bacterium]
MRGGIPIAEMEALIDTARGESEADLLLVNGQVVNVFSGEIQTLNVAIKGNRIAGIGDYQQGLNVLDLDGRYIIPGLIDSHIHIESSLLTPAAFAAAAVPHGTTAIIADPHEIVNVGGLAAWDYMVKAARDLPLDIFYNVPSCVPATHMETAGATMGLAEVAQAFEIFPASPGLAELMNYPGVLYKNPVVLEMIKQTLADGRRIDGHAPALNLKELNAYMSTGISSDHECTSREDALEKMRRGL